MKPVVPHPLPRLALVLGCFLVNATASAQATSSSTATASGTQRDPIELSPFVVDDTKDVGYLAGNTLAGSRLNTSLKDTPASISVLTSEFLSDIGAFQLNEALAYAVNIEFEVDDAREAINEFATFQNYQTYRVRGLLASVSRNYFSWNDRAIPDEAAFVDRIEDSRGPNSVLFGVGSPGGVINVNTKQALLGRTLRQVSATLGRYDTMRATLDLNQPLLDNKLAARLILVYNENNGFRHFAGQQHQRALLTTKYELTERTKFRVEFERGQYKSNTPRAYNLDNRYLRWDAAGRPTFATAAAATSAQRADFGLNATAAAANQPLVTYISNNDAAFRMNNTLNTTGAIPPGQEGVIALNGVITDRSLSDFSINVGGPAQDRFTRYGIFTAIAEHRFTDKTFLEIAYNHVGMALDSRDPRGGNSLMGDANQFLTTGQPNPHVGDLYLDTNWFRTVRDDTIDVGRATLSTEFDAGKWGNYRFAGLGEYEESFIGSTTMREFWIDSATGAPAFHAVPTNAQNRVTRRSYVTEQDWGTYYISGPVGSGGLLENVSDPTNPARTLSSTWYNQGFPNEFYYTKKSGMAVIQARYFEDRLIAAAGIRRDDIEEDQLARRNNPSTGIPEIARDPSTAGVNQERRITRNLGTTKSFGLVYHLTPSVSLYYNKADNLSIPEKGAFRLPESGEPGNPIPIPAPSGEGEDFGIGVELLDGKLYAKAIYYTTDGRNQSTSSPAPIRQANTRILDALVALGPDNGGISQEVHDVRNNVGGHGNFDHISKGWEFQTIANVTDNWRFVVNYAISDAVEDNKFVEWQNWEVLNTQFLSQFDQSIPTTQRTIAEEIALYQDALAAQVDPSGIGKLGNRKHKVSLVTRYGFDSGWLKGAYVTGGYRHQSKMFTGVDADLKPVYGNSFWRADVGVGYAVQGLSKGRRLNFQLNIFNVFNERDPLVTRYDAFGAVFYEAVQEPTTWRLTTTFEF